MGRQARIVRDTPEEFILAEPLEDGTVAVGLFNLKAPRRGVGAGERPGPQRQVHGPRPVAAERPGPHENQFTVKAPRHGAELVRLTPVK